MRIVSTVLIGILMFVALLGMPLLLTHGSHHVGCPLQIAQDLCRSTIVEHFSIWQSMFASVLASLILLIGFVLIAWDFGFLRAYERVRFRFHTGVPTRPLLMQELYADGIHNRKEPHVL